MGAALLAWCRCCWLCEGISDLCPTIQPAAAPLGRGKHRFAPARTKSRPCQLNWPQHRKGSCCGPGQTRWCSGTGARHRGCAQAPPRDTLGMQRAPECMRRLASCHVHVARVMGWAGCLAGVRALGGASRRVACSTAAPAQTMLITDFELTQNKCSHARAHSLRCRVTQTHAYTHAPPTTRARARRLPACISLLPAVRRRR